jgi:hypothetical protein
LAPLLFLLPCAAMMLICMRNMRHGALGQTVGVASDTETPGTTGPQN